MINLLSFFIGLIVAYLFRKNDRLHGGDSNLIKKQIDQRADGCYMYQVEPVICPI